jgi:hypothetical protein
LEGWFEFVVVFVADYICSVWTGVFFLCLFGNVVFIRDFKKVV